MLSAEEQDDVILLIMKHDASTDLIVSQRPISRGWRAENSLAHRDAQNHGMTAAMQDGILFSSNLLAGAAYQRSFDNGGVPINPQKVVS